MAAQPQKLQGQQSLNLEKSNECNEQCNQKSEWNQHQSQRESQQKQTDFNQLNGGLKSPAVNEVQQGIVNRMKQSFESPRSGSPTGNVEHKQLGAECIMLEAQRLKEEARRQFEANEEEFRKAQAAQEEAARASEFANQITIQALNREVEGQEKLVQAGYKLMEAGARFQAEAAAIGRDRHTIINTHQRGQVRQEVQIDAPVVPPASELHVLQSRQVAQCIPVQTTEEREFVAHYQNGPQIGF